MFFFTKPPCYSQLAPLPLICSSKFSAITNILGGCSISDLQPVLQGLARGNASGWQIIIK